MDNESQLKLRALPSVIQLTKPSCQRDESAVTGRHMRINSLEQDKQITERLVRAYAPDKYCVT